MSQPLTLKQAAIALGVTALIAPIFVQSPIRQSQPQAPARASFSDPYQLCELLPSLPTRGWKDQGGGQWGCSSDYQSVGELGEKGLPSTIAYYVTGSDSDRADTVKLVLNINNESSQQQGLALLSQHANRLINKLGLEAPSSFYSSITAGQPISFQLGQGSVELYRGFTGIPTYSLIVNSAAK
jgi:hypothetical protein